MSPPLWKSLPLTRSPSATTVKTVHNTHPHANTLQHIFFLFLPAHWFFLTFFCFAQQLFTARLTGSALIQLPLSALLLFLFFFSATSSIWPPSSESQAHWLFQRLTRLKPSLASTTAAGRAASCPSRRELLCFYTSEHPMTGGRDGITESMDSCLTSTLWSKTSKTIFHLFAFSILIFDLMRLLNLLLFYFRNHDNQRLKESTCA